METTIQKWGKSLGLRIPNPLAQEIGISENTIVEISLKGSTLVVEPVRPSRRMKSRRKSIDWYLDRITPENRHEFVDDEPVGREVI